MFWGAAPCPTKKGCGNAAALLLEGLSLLCRPGFPRGALAPKIAASSYRRLSRDRQDQKRRAAPNVPVFPGMPPAVPAVGSAASRPYCRFFLKNSFDQGTKIATIHCVGGPDQPPRPRIARTTAVRSSTEPAASWSSRFSPWGQFLGCQFMPISTAIRIRSEWFLAPSFCLSNEVVLATVL